MSANKHIVLLLAYIIAAAGCNSDYLPKPTGYFKIPFPGKVYRQFNKAAFPYTFEYPVYAEIKQDSSFFDEEPENHYWINIDFPRFNGRIYVSYYRLGGKTTFKIKKKSGYTDSAGTNTLEGLVKGSYSLTFKHSYKASSIEDSVFRTRQGIEGIYFTLGGNTATANQFLLTDSVKHFLRGALYFDATPNEDSLNIVNNFLRQDMIHLINTFQWKNN